MINRAFGELSIDCDYWGNGVATYDAHHVLGLQRGPADQATEEIVEMMDNLLSERVPGAGRRKGTYPGRTSDTISITVIISNLGKGAAMDRIEYFYNEATRLMSEVRLNTIGQRKALGGSGEIRGIASRPVAVKTHNLDQTPDRGRGSI